MNSESPINKNRIAYQQVEQTLSGNPQFREVLRVKDVRTGLMYLRVDGRNFFVHVNKQGAFPPCNASKDAPVFVVCDTTNEICAYEPYNGAWRAIHFQK
jgi:hypothetical protein